MDKNKELVRQKILVILLLIFVLVFVGFNLVQQYISGSYVQNDSIKLEKVIEKQVYVENSAGIDAAKRFSTSVLNVIPVEELNDFVNPVGDLSMQCFDSNENCKDLAIMLTSDGIVLYGGKYRDRPENTLLLVNSEGEDFQIESVGEYRGFDIWKLVERGEISLAEEKRTRFFKIKPTLLGDLRRVEVGQRVMSLIASIPGYYDIEEGIVNTKVTLTDSVILFNSDVTPAKFRFSNGGDNVVYSFDLSGHLLSARSVDGKVLFANDISALLERLDQINVDSLEVLDVGLKCFLLDRSLSLKLDREVDYGCLVAGGVDQNLHLTFDDAVKQGSLAEKAGLQMGDIILEINNKSLLNTDVVEIIMELVPGEKIEINVLRGDKSILLSV